jgi:hypothetical protein
MVQQQQVQASNFWPDNSSRRPTFNPKFKLAKCAAATQLISKTQTHLESLQKPPLVSVSDGTISDFKSAPQSRPLLFQDSVIPSRTTFQAEIGVVHSDTVYSTSSPVQGSVVHSSKPDVMVKHVSLNKKTTASQPQSQPLCLTEQQLSKKVKDKAAAAHERMKSEIDSLKETLQQFEEAKKIMKLCTSIIAKSSSQLAKVKKPQHHNNVSSSTSAAGSAIVSLASRRHTDAGNANQKTAAAIRHLSDAETNPPARTHKAGMIAEPVVCTQSGNSSSSKTQVEHSFVPEMKNQQKSHSITAKLKLEEELRATQEKLHNMRKKMGIMLKDWPQKPVKHGAHGNMAGSISSTVQAKSDVTYVPAATHNSAALSTSAISDISPASNSCTSVTPTAAVTASAGPFPNRQSLKWRPESSPSDVLSQNLRARATSESKANSSTNVASVTTKGEQKGNIFLEKQSLKWPSKVPTDSSTPGQNISASSTSAELTAGTKLVVTTKEEAKRTQTFPDKQSLKWPPKKLSNEVSLQKSSATSASDTGSTLTVKRKADGQKASHFPDKQSLKWPPKAPSTEAPLPISSVGSLSSASDSGFVLPVTRTRIHHFPDKQCLKWPPKASPKEISAQVSSAGSASSELQQKAGASGPVVNMRTSAAVNMRLFPDRKALKWLPKSSPREVPSDTLVVGSSPALRELKMSARQAAAVVLVSQPGGKKKISLSGPTFNPKYKLNKNPGAAAASLTTSGPMFDSKYKLNKNPGAAASAFTTLKPLAHGRSRHATPKAINKYKLVRNTAASSNVTQKSAVKKRAAKIIKSKYKLQRVPTQNVQVIKSKYKLRKVVTAQSASRRLSFSSVEIPKSTMSRAEAWLTAKMRYKKWSKAGQNQHSEIGTFAHAGSTSERFAGGFKERPSTHSHWNKGTMFHQQQYSLYKSSTWPQIAAQGYKWNTKG